MTSPVVNAFSNRSERRRLSFRKRLVFSTFVTVFFLLMLELLLALFGVKPRYVTEDPLVGFAGGPPLFVPRADGEILKTNPVKLAFFNDQQFTVAKSPRTYRIFCLGGSTTFGHPYHDSTSFCGWLRELLKEVDPERDWQVINCGGVSYASYRICYLMQELARHQPDLFIFYEGHNEFLEERTYSGIKQRTTLQSTADFVTTRTRLGSTFGRLLHGTITPGPGNQLTAEVDTILDRSVGPERYHYDPAWTEGVVSHFRSSLDRACAIARGSRAKIIFVKPAANVRDFRPFKSESTITDPDKLADWKRLVTEGHQFQESGQFDDAAARLIEATRLDPHHALTHWEAGDALFRAGRLAEARASFDRAIDEDVCPLRAITAIRNAVDDAARQNGVPCVDFPMLIEDQLEQIAHHRIPGNESFLDHVHPTIEQNRRLAWALLDELVQLDVTQRHTLDEQVLAQVSNKVLGPIDKKQHALALVQVIQVLSWAGKNAEALELTTRAEETCPGLSEVVSYRGRLLEKSGRSDEAFECFKEAVQRNPKDSLAQFRLGSAYLRRQEFESARECFDQAVHDTPVQAPAVFQFELHMALGQSYVGLERWRDAAEQFQIALQLSPNSADAKTALATVATHAGSGK